MSEEELKKPKYLVHFENNKITKMELINDYISKDKIREKIKYYQELYKEDNSPNDFLIEQDLFSKMSVLQELLEG